MMSEATTSRSLGQDACSQPGAALEGRPPATDLATLIAMADTDEVVRLRLLRAIGPRRLNDSHGTLLGRTATHPVSNEHLRAGHAPFVEAAGL